MSLTRLPVWRIIRLLAALACLYLIAVLSSRTLSQMNRREIHPVFGPGAVPHVLNIAHQGGNLERPDETLESFRNGLNVGADILEMDVHLSFDDHLIVIHDSDVNRTTDGSGRISDLTLEEIQSLDAAYWWPYHSNDDLAKEHVPANQEFPWRGKDLRLLTLEEVLSSFPGVPLVVEIKSGGSQAAMISYRLLKKFNRLDDVLVVSSNSEILQAFRELSPETPTGADRKEVTRFWILGKLGLTGFAGMKATALQVPLRQGKLKIITPGFIRRAHRNGLAVHAWTINSEEEMRRLEAMGVDGIITDRPSLLSGL